MQALPQPAVSTGSLGGSGQHQAQAAAQVAAAQAAAAQHIDHQRMEHAAAAAQAAAAHAAAIQHIEHQRVEHAAAAAQAAAAQAAAAERIDELERSVGREQMWSRKMEAKLEGSKREVETLTIQRNQERESSKASNERLNANNNALVRVSSPPLDREAVAARLVVLLQPRTAPDRHLFLQLSRRR